MTIKVYAHEILDGLEKAVANTNSIAYTSTIDCSKPEDGLRHWLSNSNSAKATNLNQEDLFYMKSILVSTGWNLNDDIFVSEELWAARKTPEDKQFNFMHNELDIIGHITSNEVFDFEGNLISDEVEAAPQNFNIVTNSVIYRNWSDASQRDRVEKLIAEIKEGKWFVSMECFFPSFDYALKDSSGAIRLVDRNEASAFLTKHLRVYGGTGEYQTYKIGRVLRNLTFSGKGLVNQPANPRSIILREENLSHANIQEIDDMSEDLNKKLVEAEAQIITLKAELSSTQATVQSLNSVKAEVESLKAEVAKREDTLAGLQKENNTLQETINTLKASLQAAEAARDELNVKFQEIEAKARLEKRKAALVDAGVEADDLEDALASFDSVEEAAFEKMVAVMKKKAKKYPKKDEEESDDSEASLDALNNADKVDDASASITETEEEDKQAKVSMEAVAFFSKNLATTKNSN